MFQDTCNNTLTVITGGKGAYFRCFHPKLLDFVALVELTAHHIDITNVILVEFQAEALWPQHVHWKQLFRSTRSSSISSQYVKYCSVISCDTLKFFHLFQLKVFGPFVSVHEPLLQQKGENTSWQTNTTGINIPRWHIKHFLTVSMHWKQTVWTEMSLIWNIPGTKVQHLFKMYVIKNDIWV